MPPQSRGKGYPKGLQSKSTPNLPTLKSLSLDSIPPVPTPPSAKTDAPSSLLSPTTTSPSEAASVEDNLSTEDSFTLDASGLTSGSEEEDNGDDGFDFDGPAPAVQAPRSTSTGPGTKPKRPVYSHGSRSHSHLPHTSAALFPPFYNRPPTPLPPSPSLTSLLRPSFSTQTSRPTTPDSSDVEAVPGPHRHGGAANSSKRAPSAASTGTGTGTGTPTNNLASSFASATPIPRAAPKVPTYEYYGFFIYLASSFAFLMYILWAYLPRPFLHQLGIYYYPNRWWALAVPAWLVVLIMWIYVALASYNVDYLTLPMKNCENLVDDAAQIAVLDARGKIVRMGKDDEKGSTSAAHSRRSSAMSVGKGFAVGQEKEIDWKSLWSESTDAVLDVPIGGVCEILYGAGREKDEDEDEDDSEDDGEGESEALKV